MDPLEEFEAGAWRALGVLAVLAAPWIGARLGDAFAESLGELEADAYHRGYAAAMDGRRDDPELAHELASDD